MGFTWGTFGGCVSERGGGPSWPMPHQWRQTVAVLAKFTNIYPRRGICTASEADGDWSSDTPPGHSAPVQLAGKSKGASPKLPSEVISTAVTKPSPEAAAQPAGQPACEEAVSHGSGAQGTAPPPPRGGRRSGRPGSGPRAPLPGRPSPLASSRKPPQAARARPATCSHQLHNC